MECKVFKNGSGVMKVAKAHRSRPHALHACLGIQSHAAIYQIPWCNKLKSIELNTKNSIVSLFRKPYFLFHAFEKQSRGIGLPWSTWPCFDDKARMTCAGVCVDSIKTECSKQAGN